MPPRALKTEACEGRGDVHGKACKEKKDMRRASCSGIIPKEAEVGQPVEMTLDEFETVRLMDRLGFDQEDCAAQMNVSRTTVQAIYDSARKKISAGFGGRKAAANPWRSICGLPQFGRMLWKGMLPPGAFGILRRKGLLLLPGMQG